MMLFVVLKKNSIVSLMTIVSCVFKHFIYNMQVSVKVPSHPIPCTLPGNFDEELLRASNSTGKSD